MTNLRAQLGSFCAAHSAGKFRCKYCRSPKLPNITLSWTETWTDTVSVTASNLCSEWRMCPATCEWLRLPTFTWAIILASFDGVGRLTSRKTHFFKRKNFAPPEMGLVTTNCEPSTGGL